MIEFCNTGQFDKIQCMRQTMTNESIDELRVIKQNTLSGIEKIA